MLLVGRLKFFIIALYIAVIHVKGTYIMSMTNKVSMIAIAVCASLAAGCGGGSGSRAVAHV